MFPCQIRKNNLIILGGSQRVFIRLIIIRNTINIKKMPQIADLLFLVPDYRIVVHKKLLTSAKLIISVYHVDSALKLGNYNVGRSGEILTLPLYMAFLLTMY